jgi:hypothetical protein
MNSLLAQVLPFAQLVGQIRQNQPGGGADAGTGAGVAGILAYVCFALVYLVALGIVIASYWVIFTKAGEPGWAAIVPVYNLIVLCKICDKPTWWGIVMVVSAVLCCSPVTLVFQILLMIELAKRFGKETGFAIGLILISPVFLPMLAFGSAKYIPPEPAADGYDDDRPRRRRRPRDEEDDYEDDR